MAEIFADATRPSPRRPHKHVLKAVAASSRWSWSCAAVAASSLFVFVRDVRPHADTDVRRHAKAALRVRARPSGWTGSRRIVHVFMTSFVSYRIPRSTSVDGSRSRCAPRPARRTDQEPTTPASPSASSESARRTARPTPNRPTPRPRLLVRAVRRSRAPDPGVGSSSERYGPACKTRRGPTPTPPACRHLVRIEFDQSAAAAPPETLVRNSRPRRRRRLRACSRSATTRAIFARTRRTRVRSRPRAHPVTHRAKYREVRGSGRGFEPARRRGSKGKAGKATPACASTDSARPPRASSTPRVTSRQRVARLREAHGGEREERRDGVTARAFRGVRRRSSFSSSDAFSWPSFHPRRMFPVCATRRLEQPRGRTRKWRGDRPRRRPSAAAEDARFGSDVKSTRSEGSGFHTSIESNIGD